MMGRVLVVGLVFATACASSSRSEQCDPATANCGAIDASAIADATSGIDTPPDAPKLPFGSPCTDSGQCQSDICVLVATGGVCTALCPPGCPTDGWGCFGVTGVVDPGEVTQVCVPISDQLCTPCAQDSECTLIGMDACLTESSGRKYCGRDCSTVACPSNYDCQQEGAGKECVPHSGACDCNVAGQSGTEEDCNIMTPLNTTCAGSSTCAGAAGWGTCQPPSMTDVPDNSYIDSNCDGIDGDASKGIFVAGGGANTATCGLVYNSPCQTISYGIVRGVQESRPNVYVQSGTYNEVVVLLNGVNVWGGYDFNWQRGPYSDAAHRVVVTGGQDTTAGGDGEYLTVRAHDLIVPVKLDNVVLQGPAASGTAGISGRDGRSSYVVHAKAASGLTLSHVQIQAGNGAAGGVGTTGIDAPTTSAQSFMSGGSGGNGDQYSTTCDNSSRGSAGAAGTNSCASGSLTNGGGGGQGGTMDTSCGFPPHFDATSGSNGVSAALVSGSFGLFGSGGSGTNSCGPTTNGNPGRVLNGSAGGAPALVGYLGGSNSIYWYGYAGGAGGIGDNGSGGGGGGGGGGCDNGTDSYGAGGGGGGAGGCRANGGGIGGGGGGGSFGLFAVSASTVAIDTCDLARGNAGNGGTGGFGGRGQSGGVSGPGGSAHPNSATPGNGGAGAHGGHGGGGGGGNGGRSVGIMQSGDSTVTGTCNQTQGAAGSGGAGGVSAPNAPAAERDGNNGSTAGNGALEPTHTCASATSC
jgi:hypothetical protein